MPPCGAIFWQILFLCPNSTNHVPRMLYVEYQGIWTVCLFMRRRSSKIHQILHLFAPYWAPIGASPLIFAKLNPDSPKILPTKFGWNQFSGFGEVI